MNNPNSSLRCIVTIGLILIYLPLFAQQSYPAEVQRRIDQVEAGLIGNIRIEGEPAWSLKERMTHYKVSAVTVAVIHNYKVEWAKAYGWADVSAKTQATPQTLFQAASISKSLNGVGVLKLVQDKKVDPGTDINTYLTSWKFPYDERAKGKKITLNNLLSHTAGLTVHGFGGYAKGNKIPTTVQILNGEAPANSGPVRSEFEPDLRVMYSGGGTTISQLIVMDVTGQPYAKFMEETVLRPMGMMTSSFQPDVNVTSLLATGYHADGTEIAGKFQTYPEMGAAALWTNPTELGNYIIETQLSLVGKSSKVLSQEFTKRRLTPYKENAALGVFIQTNDGEKYFEHGGSNQGFRSQYSGSMSGGYGYAIMVNSDDGSIIQEVANAIAATYGWKGLLNSKTKKLATVTADKLKTLEGYYQLRDNNNLQLQFTAQGNQLQLREVWTGRTVMFMPESDVEFFSHDFPFTLKFTVDSGGMPTEVLAVGADVWVKKGK